MRGLLLLLVAVALGFLAVRTWAGSRYPTHEVRVGARTYDVMDERRHCDRQRCYQMLGYRAESLDSGAIRVAARDLFQYLRPKAASSGDHAIAVVAVEPGWLGIGAPERVHAIGFVETYSGQWVQAFDSIAPAAQFFNP